MSANDPKLTFLRSEQCGTLTVSLKHWTREMYSMRLWILLLWSVTSSGWAADYLTAGEHLTLVSFNDGEVPAVTPPFESSAVVDDSVTVIHLSPDRPPEYRHAAGIGRNSIVGPPYAAVAGGFALAVNHQFRIGVDIPVETVGDNQIQIINLADDPRVVDTVLLDGLAFMAKPIASNRFLVASEVAWQIFQLSDLGKATQIGWDEYKGFAYGFDVAEDGTILAVVASAGDFISSQKELVQFQLHGESVRLVGPIDANGHRIDNPVAIRISPDGNTALALNGLGGSDGRLDDVLVLQRIGEVFRVTTSVASVGDGLESLAFHPSGRFAVVTCLNMHARHDASHLAVIGLEGKPRLISHVSMEPIPEGIEFSPGGNMLFVGSTHANHIVVFDVQGKLLRRNPQVLLSQFGHASLAVTFR